MMELLIVVVGVMLAAAGTGGGFAEPVPYVPTLMGGPRDPEPQEPSGLFTTAAEVRPVLEATQGDWVMIREYDGKDLVYFTHLLSWRCGIWEIQYSFNDLDPDSVQLLPMEPCHEGTRMPNALTDETGDFLPYVEAPLGSVEGIGVEVFYDDGTSDWVWYTRDFVLRP